MKRWSTMLANGPCSLLVDGLGDGPDRISEGMRLGRLKQWLHRLQIEEGLSTLEQMEGLLSRTPFEHGSPQDCQRQPSLERRHQFDVR